jgi:hypothetical protein
LSEVKPPLGLTLLAVTVPEAAALLGLSEGAFRTYLLPDCPKLYIGRSVRIPLRGLTQFVEERAQAESQHQRESAAELMARVGSRSA